MKCQNCHVGYMEVPRSNHPAYLECETCGAIELTYEPLDYQEEIHKIPYETFINKRGVPDIRPQIIFTAGG